MPFNIMLADVVLGWETTAPIALAVLGLIGWLIKKLVSTHEDRVGGAMAKAQHAEEVAHRRANEIEIKCEAERLSQAAIQTRVAVIETELKAHRREVTSRFDTLERLIKNGGRHDT